MEKKIDLVIFDMDGLMIDTESVYIKVATSVTKQFDLPISEELIRAVIGVNALTCEKMFEEVLGKNSPIKAKYDKEMDIAYSRYFEEHPLETKKGLFELLDYLDKAGIRKAVATSTSEASASVTLKEIGVIDRFDYIIYGDHLTASKPAPDIFLTAAKEVGVPTENTIVLEDSFNGILAASSGEMRCVWVPDVCIVPEEVQKKAWKKVEDLQKVISLIEEVNKTDN